MEAYLLLLLMFYPLVILGVLKIYSRGLFNLLFIGPIVSLYLAISSYFDKEAIELVFWTFSDNLSVGLELDILSGLIATAVLSIGIIILRYSVRYMDDDPNKNNFLNRLAYTLCCVLVMLMSPNLALFFLSWIGTSYFLHKLLTHFSKRSGAKKAAYQKFWVSRLGDIFIVSSGALLLFAFGSLDFGSIFALMNDPNFVSENSLAINIVSIFLVLGAMTKSAQYPFHYWLPNTMETPTPVSALMHAGIINAGGYLVVRMSPLLSNASVALAMLALVGGFTAIYGCLIMLAQTNIKKSLAYSTISQMGFMMLQCGLGAFSIAVVHIIGHAFYKAYAFLGSGTASDFGKLNRYFPVSNKVQNIWTSIFAVTLSLIGVFGLFTSFGYAVLEKPGALVLLLILSLAIAQVFLSSENSLVSLLTALSIMSLYFMLSIGMMHLLQDIIPNQKLSLNPLDTFVLVASICSFVVLYLIQNTTEKLSQTELGKRLYVKALNGSFK